MPKEYINPNSLFPSLPHGFSQVVIASGRTMVFISGQTAWDGRKKIVGEENLLEQTRQALRNVAVAMEAAGGTLEDVVALRIYIVNYQAEIGGAVDISSLTPIWRTTASGFLTPVASGSSPAGLTSHPEDSVLF